MMNFGSRVGQMATGTMTVTSTPQLATLGKGLFSRGKTTLEIYNKSGTMAIGGKDVTAATGIPIAAGTSKIIPVNNEGGEIFIVGSGTAIIAEYTS